MLLRLVILGVMLCLCSCVPGMQQSSRMDVTTYVYKQPEKPLDLSGKKVLILPVSFYAPQAHDWVPSVTGLVEDILSQEKVFRAIECKKEKFESMEKLLLDALNSGFDYVLLSSIPPVISPAGNTNGWVGLDMKLVDVSTNITVWHLYGKAFLCSAPTRRTILWEAAYADAPSVSSGLAAIVKNMAITIKRQGRGPGAAPH